MLKRIKKYGDSFVISFTKEEMLIYKLKLNDIIDISDLVKIDISDGEISSIN